jgi:hypothetical protein
MKWFTVSEVYGPGLRTFLISEATVWGSAESLRLGLTATILHLYESPRFSVPGCH